MDEADMSQSRLEMEETIRRKYTTAPPLEVGHTGYCHNCGEPLTETMRFCDGDCMSDWQKRRSLK